MLKENNIQTNNIKLDEIIKNYLKIYNIFFKYIFFITTVIVSLIISYVLIKQNNRTNDNPEFDQEILASKQYFENQQKQKVNKENLEIKIIWGKIIEENNKIESNNNLILIWWIVLPKLTFIDPFNTVKTIDYFSNKEYNILELESFIKKIVLNESTYLLENPKSNLAQIEDNIINTFSLDCINYNKIYTKVCNHYIKTYTENFFYYDISKDYIWFKNVIEKLSDKEEICSNIKKYILYSKDTTISQNIFEACWKQYINEIQDTKAFVQINKWIDNKYIESITYQNKALNHYKLLSAQQIIFKEFLNWKIPTERINNYLEFLENTLKLGLLDNFYIDEAYWFNNYYLSDNIDKFDDYSDAEAKEKIYIILQKIISINYWSKLENIPWLENLITNKNIIKKLKITIDNNTIQDYNSWKITALSKDIDNSDYLIINTKKIEWDNMNIDWYIKIDTKNKKYLISSEITLTYNWQFFIVSMIKINDMSNINNIMNKFISDQKKTLPETYEYLKESLWFYDNTGKDSNKQSENTCNELKNYAKTGNISITSCSDRLISINNKDIIYNFTYNNYIITKIEISNTTLNSEIKDSFWRIKTNEDNIIKTIINVVTYRDNENFKTKYINAETVEKIEKQIGPILEFAQSWNKLLFETNIKWIDFIINYDKEKQILGPVYFKNVLINTRPLIIKNIYIKLDDIDETKKIRSNPINYIKLKDKSSYFLYQKANN